MQAPDNLVTVARRLPTGGQRLRALDRRLHAMPFRDAGAWGAA